MNVANLDGTDGFKIVGVAPGDTFGWSVAGAHDVNGDGLNDVIISAPNTSPNGQYQAGTVYVLYGQHQNFAAVLNASDITGSVGFQIDGSVPTGQIGSSVSSGDFNGDGISDILIGGRNLPLSDPSSGGLSGESSGGGYIVYGQPGDIDGPVNVGDLDGSQGTVIEGLPVGANGGFAVGVVDFNGDGRDDAVIGAITDPTNGPSAGATYVIYGEQSSSGSIDVATLNGSDGFKFYGVEAGERNGFSFASGDFNGDGIGDLLVGAPNGDSKGPNSGDAYVLFGTTSGEAATVDLMSLDGQNGFHIAGYAASTRSAWSVAAGDINGDGIADMIIGQIDGAPNGIFHAGATFVIYGSTEGFPANVDLAALSPSQGFEIDGYAYQQESGCAVTDAGDINGDGIDDLLIGAQHGDPGGNTFPSEAFVVFGKAGGFTSPINLADLDGVNGFRIDDEELGGQLGVTVSPAGDLNGDGFDDLIVAGRYDIRSQSYLDSPGAAYVIYGHATSGPPIPAPDLSFTGTSAQDNFAGQAGADTFHMEQGGNDVVFGGGGDDTFYFGASFTKDDAIDGGEGFDKLVLDGAYDASVSFVQATLNNVEEIELVAGHNYVLRPNYNTVLVGQVLTIDGSALTSSDKLTVTAPAVGALGDVMGGSLDIKGGAGADKLAGGPNADVMAGGLGNDIYYVDNAHDVVIEGAGGGTADRVYASVDYTLQADAQVEFLYANAGDTGLTLTGNDYSTHIYGNSGDDYLTGGSGADTIDGKGGADVMAGGLGNDMYYVDNAKDVVIEGAGGGTTDRVYASVDYTLQADAQVEYLYANAGSAGLTLTGNDYSHHIYGGAGADHLNGGTGNDVINGEGGADVMAGGLGDDSYYVDDAHDVVTEGASGGTADRVYASVDYTLQTGTQVEFLYADAGSAGLTLTGNSYSTHIYGNSGADHLNGGTGNDIINGEGGADVMAGGLGNDSYFVDNAHDVVTEGTGGGTADRVYASVDYTLQAGTQVEYLYANTDGGITLTGNIYSHYIYGGGGADHLNGSTGNDIINGEGGSDTMAGGTGSDTYFVDNGSDVVTDAGTGTTDKLDKVYSSVDYTLGADAHIEYFYANSDSGVTLTGNAYSHHIYGGAGADHLNGGGGDDIINGEGGVDTMAGGTGNDLYFVANSSDVVNEAVGNVGGTSDKVYASVNYTLTAGSGIEQLHANAGTTGLTLGGNEFNNAIFGGAGADTIAGGGGRDLLIGGGGNDTFVFKAVSDSPAVSGGYDTIEDFSQGHDKIDLTAIDANTTDANPSGGFHFIGSAAFSQAGDLRAVVNTANNTTTIYGDVDGDHHADIEITLLGETTLTANDFVPHI
jgi:Ca2+-binding RTX toxin-like protein